MSETFHLESRFGMPTLELTYHDVNEKNISHFQRFNSAIFPIRFDVKFYKDALKAPPGFVKLVYHDQVIVGAVCCRKESSKDLEKLHSKLYIMTLGVLPTYRERGIGHKLITDVLHMVTSTDYCNDIQQVYLHVQDGNQEALRFYQHHGFEISQRLVRYYKRLQPSDCFVVCKVVNQTTSQSDQQTNSIRNSST